ncbi:MAG TPA: PPOX class F420-dependent oxidoreductase [Dehalococcoidia bacterium]
MGAAVPEPVARLLQEPNIAHLATLMPDGSPQVTPVWVDFDGVYVLVNTAEGRQKERNVRRDARVAVEVMRQDNPYYWAAIRGRVVDLVHEGADEHIDRLARKYLGRDRYPARDPNERRIVLKIEPERVTFSGRE